MKEKVCIIGCGYLGEALLTKFLSFNYDVVGIRRRLSTNSNIVSCDITSDKLQKILLKGYDYIYYLASPSTSSYAKIYDDNLSHIISILTKSQYPMKRFILASSTSVYRNGDGEIVNEESKIISTTEKSGLLLHAEKLVLNSQIPATILRFSGIYGPKRDIYLKRIISDEVGLTEKDYYTNRIHVKDASDFCFYLAKEKIKKKIFIVTDSMPTKKNTLIKYLAKRMNIKAPLLTNVQSPARGFTNKQCSNAKMLSTGFRLTYPDFESGYKELLKNYE